MKEFDDPLRLEMCVRSMLYDYRYKNKRDLFICNLETVKKAFNECEKSIANMIQKGGASYVDLEIKNINKKIKKNNEKLYKEQIIIEDFRKKLKGYNIESESDTNSSDDEK